MGCFITIIIFLLAIIAMLTFNAGLITWTWICGVIAALLIVLLGAAAADPQ